MSEDTGEPATTNVTNTFIASENGNGPLTLSKRGKVMRFVVKHDTTIYAIGVGTLAFAAGLAGARSVDKGQLAEWREYVKNLRAELGDVEIDHQTAMEFIDYKKLNGQFEKFIAEKSAA